MITKIVKHFVVFLLIQGLAVASNVKTLGQYDRWTAYHVQDKPEYCYVTATIESASKKRRFIVTVREDGGEINYIAGTPLSEKAPATLAIGKTSYPLFCQQDSAWTKNPRDDKVIVAALRKIKDIQVSCESKKSQKIQDVVSLKGFPKAYEVAHRACFEPKKPAVPVKKQ